ncbi:MAG TPA: SRPBCC family protein [Kofleriaceae bacterium]|nr:SRPBCC family protein [Kofleriaceae bacterium]
MNRTRIVFLGGLGLGAALMYALDPASGRRRRARMRDRMSSLGRRERDLFGKGARDLGHRLEGGVHALGGPGDGASDRVVADRVRAAIGRAVSHPGAIEVDVQGGSVTLTGQVLERETRELMRRVGRVAGVRSVDDRLERHRTPDGIPSLQGEGKPLRRRLERDVWPPAWRLVAGTAGVGVGALGLARGGLVGRALLVGGGALALRAASNMPITRLTGVGSGRRMIELRKTLLVHSPIDEVYRFWIHVENFPRFMEHVRSVKRNEKDPLRSHWEVAGPGGVTMKWDAEVTRHVPDELFSWKTLPGSGVEHAGAVFFEEVGEDTTRVHVRMTYNPPAGALGHAVASLLGADPKTRMDEDLVRFKSLLEEGRTRAHGQQISREELSGPGIL